MSAGRRFRRAALALATTAALGGGLWVGLGPGVSVASSHREAPLTAADPQIDGTDLYAFRSPDRPRTVTFVSNWIPFEEPAGGPNFFLWAPGVRYDVNIDNNGDAKPDVIYRWVFRTHYRNPNTFLYNTGPVNSLTDPTLNIYQTYDLYRIVHGKSHLVLKNAMAAPSDVGRASMPNYRRLEKEATRTFAKGTSKTLAGQSDDPTPLFRGAAGRTARARGIGQALLHGQVGQGHGLEALPALAPQFPRLYYPATFPILPGSSGHHGALPPY